MRKTNGRIQHLLGFTLLLLLLSCDSAEDRAVADATCEALSQERFEEALSLSTKGASAEGAGREVAECRCLAFLSTGNRSACEELLAPLLAQPEADDWVPHSVLSKLMVRFWQSKGDVENAAVLAKRAAPIHRHDLDLLQSELMLRSAIQDEADVLTSLEERLEADPSWLPQRIVLALGWKRRSAYEDALRVLGDTPPPKGHALTLAWNESRIQAQAARGDLDAVQQSFETWKATGWDPIDLGARYALRLSVEQLRDPAHNTIDLLRESIAEGDQIRDPNLKWGLHRRLIAELLGAGHPEQALAAYDAAVGVVPLEGITRAEIERALALARGEIDLDAPGFLRFEIPPALASGTLSVSPGADQPPDAGYREYAFGPSNTVRVEVRAGLHPQRWIIKDDQDQIRASGATWPEAGSEITIRPEIRSADTPPARAPMTQPPADGRRRVFAILADCGDWRLAEYLRAREELPFHDRLTSEGYRSVLESRPAFTAAALQSLVWPAHNTQRSRLGWIHHLGLELAGLEAVGENPVDFLSWVLPERPNLFATLGAGERVTANMLLSHGRIEAGRHAELIGPDGRQSQLASADAYRALRPDEREAFPALLHDAKTKQFGETIAAEMDAAEEIAREGKVDFLFLRLEALDLLTHAHFAALDGQGQDDAKGPLLDAYRYIDQRLAALHARLDADDWLVVMSDHGIRSAMQHEEDALFFAIGDGVPAGRAPGKPALRGVPASLAAMLQEDTTWPVTGTTPWLISAPSDAKAASIAARP
ncbi:MAG: alkaline phosphatase family protein [Myxococcota bacterium]